MKAAPETPVKKYSVAIRGHRTSFSLEEPFMRELRRIAAARAVPLAVLVADIDAARDQKGGLSSALRLHVLDDLKRAATDRGEGVR